MEENVTKLEVKKPEAKIAKTLVQYNVSKTTSLEELKIRMKTRYNVRFVTETDDKFVFENNTNIVELIKK